MLLISRRTTHKEWYKKEIFRVSWWLSIGIAFLLLLLYYLSITHDLILFYLDISINRDKDVLLWSNNDVISWLKENNLIRFVTFESTSVRMLVMKLQVFGEERQYYARFDLLPNHSLHKKWNFPLRISSVNMTKSVVSCGVRHIYWRNP